MVTCHLFLCRSIPINKFSPLVTWCLERLNPPSWLVRLAWNPRIPPTDWADRAFLCIIVTCQENNLPVFLNNSWYPLDISPSPRLISDCTPVASTPDFSPDTPLKKLRWTRYKVSQETWEGSAKFLPSRRWSMRSLTVSGTLFRARPVLLVCASVTTCNYLCFAMQRVKQIV